MLEALHIRDYAIVDSLDLSIESGLTALTGETGSGKSVVIGALGAAIGARVSPDEIRAGRDECEVTAVFAGVRSSAARGWLDQRSISLGGEALIMRRVARRKGRGAAYVQSVPVPLADYAELGALLLEIHGQHEHQALLSASEQRRLLDRHAGIDRDVGELSTVFRQLSGLREKTASLCARRREAHRDRELLEHSVAEIAAAALREGEEEELRAQRQVLVNVEKIAELIGEARAATAESRAGAVSQLRVAHQSVVELAELDPDFADLARQVETTLYEAEDIAEQLSHAESRPDAADGLQVVDDRLQGIRAITRKYGGSEAAAIAYAEDCGARLGEHDSAQEEIDRSEQVLDQLERSATSAALQISKARSGAAARLANDIEFELRQLGMPHSRFVIELTQTPEALAATGIDAVEFFLEANPGEGAAPLRSVGSGGELSRVMLALRAAPSGGAGAETTVFDEIDAGVGGQVGVAIGERLRRVAGSRQVLCITHLATVAARADNHFRAEKRTDGERTVATVEVVHDQVRVDELARMLAGDRKEGIPREHASQLLATARASAT